MNKVLITQPIHPQAMNRLEGKAEIIIPPDPSAVSILPLVADVDAIILRTSSTITKEIIDHAEKLKVISRTGAGVDNVDIDAANKRGILICNLPGINTTSVAEHALMLILALSKRLFALDKAVRKGNWNVRKEAQARDLEGKLLGIVGFGRIGQTVAQKAQSAFAMQIIAYDPYVQKAPGHCKDIRLTKDIEEVFQRADVVSVHVPYSATTHHLINKDLLELMQEDAFFINTSRGAVVDESALVDVLEKGKIAGAGLDVFEQEPPAKDNPLLAMNNVILTPHTGALTKECALRMANGAVEAVLDVLGGRQPKYIFNKDSLIK